MRQMSEIKYRIHTVEQTRKITSAMHLISVSKMRKAIRAYDANIMYFRRVRQAMKTILKTFPEVSHPFLQRENHGAGHTAYIVIASDKGMVGGYNHDVLKLAESHMKAHGGGYIFTVGHMAWEAFTRKGYMVDVDFLQGAQNPGLYNARAIAEDILELYGKGLMDRIYVVFTRMHGRLTQQPTIYQLLPVQMESLVDVEDMYQDDVPKFEYEPSPQLVMDALIPQYIIGILHSMLMQSYAAEHSARMQAMDQATRSAEDMMMRLRMEYNRARQDAITRELTEIVGAAEALNGRKEA